jgi:hypothetical protein
MESLPPPPLAQLLRTTLHLVEYYAGPGEKDALIRELKRTLRWNIAQLDLRESTSAALLRNSAGTPEES